MSRIELDDLDRGSVDSARRILADSQAADYGHMDITDLLCMVGSLQSAVSFLLAVIDQTDR